MDEKLGLLLKEMQAIKLENQETKQEMKQAFKLELHDTKTEMQDLKLRIESLENKFNKTVNLTGKITMIGEETRALASLGIMRMT